ncbi:MAG: alpha/beta hydrolase [Aureispira sp.]|nr:alpha/beta hydrolase [Aureispira sp.]
MRFLGFIILFSLLTPQVWAQYQTSIRYESKVILPPNYDTTKTYPALVLMPYTGGCAEDFFNKYAKESMAQSSSLSGKFSEILELYNARHSTDRSFIVILPHGVGSTKDHSWQGFAACIERYEKRVRKDLKKFIPKYNINTDQVVIGGVSLGGDLSWALSMRNPELFKGAIVTGSRCSYPPEEKFPILKAKNYSFFLAMGMEEGKHRLTGMRYARQLLDSNRVAYLYKEMPFLSHNRAPLWLFFDGIDYTLYDDNKTAVDHSAAAKWVNKLVGDYIGDVEVNDFDLEKDKELLAKGDGLWMPTKSTLLENQIILVRKINDQKISIHLFRDDNPLPPLEAYLSVRDDAVILEVPDQLVGSYRYRGKTVGGDDASKEHGTFMFGEDEQYFALDIEQLSAKNPKRFSTYSFFVLLAK